MKTSFHASVYGMLGLAIGCAVCVADAAAPEPRSRAAIPQSAALEQVTADFLQPLSRDIQRHLPDLGAPIDKENRAELQDPEFHTLWVLPKAATRTSPEETRQLGR
jgi:hypothetical protein